MTKEQRKVLIDRLEEIAIAFDDTDFGHKTLGRFLADDMKLGFTVQESSKRTAGILDEIADIGKRLKEGGDHE